MAVRDFLSRLLRLKTNRVPTAAQLLGARGEALATRHARRVLGMKIVARNQRFDGGELDIIAIDGPDIVFIEVRTRRSELAGSPERTIRDGKRRFLRRAAREFMRHRRLGSFTPRFDVAAVIWPIDGQPMVRYHKNAFSPK